MTKFFDWWATISATATTEVLATAGIVSAIVSAVSTALLFKVGVTGIVPCVGTSVIIGVSSYILICWLANKRSYSE